MPKNFRLSRRATVLTTLAAGVALGLAGCAGANSATPEEVFKAYIEALNQGEYEKALAMVADPGEVTPQNISNSTGFKYQVPLLSGEPLDPKVEAGNFYMDLEGSPVSVEVEKRDGQWKLRETEAIYPFDYTEAMATFDHFNQVGQVSFTTANGQELEQTTGFSMLPAEEERGQIITVAIDGEFVPDQEMTVEAAFLQDGWTGEFDLGELPTSITKIADELAFVDYQYDVKAHEYVTQTGAISITECWLEPVDGFDLTCRFTAPEQDFAGNEFLRPNGNGIADESKYDNLADFSVKYFSGCYYTVGERLRAEEFDGDFKVRVEDGSAVALWGHYEEETTGYIAEPSGSLLTQERVTEECSGWAPSKVGTVIQGLVPRETQTEGTVASAKL